STYAQAIVVTVIGVVFVGYTCLGGQHSILRTDLLQVVLIVGGLGALVIAWLRQSPGTTPPISSAQLQFPLSDGLGSAQLAIVLLTFGVPFLVGPDIYSRFFSGRNLVTARAAVIGEGVLLIPIVLL